MLLSYHFGMNTKMLSIAVMLLPLAPFPTFAAGPVTLETFLTIKYVKTDKKAELSVKSMKMQAEIHHYHDRGVFQLDGDKPQFSKQTYLESAVVYFKAKNAADKDLDILFDMTPTAQVQYIVYINEGDETASVYDPNGLFDEAHLKEKIQIYLKQEEEAGRRGRG